MKLTDIPLEDYQNKLKYTVVSQVYLKHHSGKRLGIVQCSKENNRRSTKHAIVKWWNYNTGTWNERNSHPRLDEIFVELPELGYYVNRRGNIAFISNLQRNRWSYGYHYPLFVDNLVDDYSLLYFYGIYPSRKHPDYISRSQRKYGDGILINNCIFKEIKYESR